MAAGAYAWRLCRWHTTEINGFLSRWRLPVDAHRARNILRRIHNLIRRCREVRALLPAYRIDNIECRRMIGPPTAEVFAASHHDARQEKSAGSAGAAWPELGANIDLSSSG